MAVLCRGAGSTGQVCAGRQEPWLRGIRNIHFVSIYILSETSYKHKAVRVISTVHAASWGHLSFIYVFPAGKRDERLYPAAAAWAVFPLPKWSCPWQHSAFPLLLHPVPSLCSPLIAAPGASFSRSLWEPPRAFPFVSGFPATVDSANFSSSVCTALSWPCDGGSKSDGRTQCAELL